MFWEIYCNVASTAQLLCLRLFSNHLDLTVMSEGNPRKQLREWHFTQHTWCTLIAKSVSLLFTVTSLILSSLFLSFFPLDYQKTHAEKIHTGVFQRQEVHVCVLHSQWLKLSEQDVCQGIACLNTSKNSGSVEENYI